MARGAGQDPAARAQPGCARTSQPPCGRGNGRESAQLQPNEPQQRGKNIDPVGCGAEVKNIFQLHDSRNRQIPGTQYRAENFLRVCSIILNCLYLIQPFDANPERIRRK